MGHSLLSEALPSPSPFLLAPQSRQFAAPWTWGEKSVSPLTCLSLDAAGETQRHLRGLPVHFHDHALFLTPGRGAPPRVQLRRITSRGRWRPLGTSETKGLSARARQTPGAPDRHVSGPLGFCAVSPLSSDLTEGWQLEGPRKPRGCQAAEGKLYSN